MSPRSAYQKTVAKEPVSINLEEDSDKGPIEAKVNVQEEPIEQLQDSSLAQQLEAEIKELKGQVQRQQHAIEEFEKKLQDLQVAEILKGIRFPIPVPEKVMEDINDKAATPYGPTTEELKVDIGTYDQGFKVKMRAKGKPKRNYGKPKLQQGR